MVLPKVAAEIRKQTGMRERPALRLLAECLHDESAPNLSDRDREWLFSESIYQTREEQIRAPARRSSR